jgi:hypothetical protein
MAWCDGVRSYLSRYTLFGVFLDRIRARWADMIMGAGVSAVLIFVITNLFGLSSFWLFLFFIGAFCVGAYAAWRAEYVPYDLIPVVDGPIAISTETKLDERHVVQSSVVIRFTMSVRNAGEPTIAENWKLEIPKLVPGLLFEPFGVSYPDGDCSCNEIPTGALRHVELRFRLDGDYPERIKKLGVRADFAVHFRDVKQKPHLCQFIA